MKRISFIGTVKFSALAIIFLLGVLSCKKETVVIPQSISLNIVNITSTSAQCGGAVSGKKITQKGVCWNISGNPTIEDAKTQDGAGEASYVSEIQGLLPATIYYLRAYATNEVGTAYGEVRQFTTDVALTIPSVSTGSISSVGQTSAQCSATIISNGNVPITRQGFCWSKNHDPTISDNYSDFSLSSVYYGGINGLSSYTTYYLRAFATNSLGTAYGNEVSFTTPGTVTDIDGNVYKTVFIAGKEWMAENLKVIRYRDGSNITLIGATNNALWSTTTAGAYCNYSDNQSYGSSYGKLYNWHATADIRNIAPLGWHIPTKAEWDEMINSLGGYGSSGAGPKLRQANSSYWAYSGYNGTNETNFSAIGAGYRSGTGSGGSFSIAQSTGFWTQTADGNSTAFYIFLDYYNFLSPVSDNKNYGFSIRCVKD